MFETAVQAKHGYAWAVISGTVAFSVLVSGWYWIVH